MTREIDDETLMAYADGELEPEMAADVARAVASDPALAARVGLFRRTREAVAEDARRHAPPVPQRLVARVRELAADAAPTDASDVHALHAPLTPPPARRWRVPLAASIALAVGLGVGLLAGRGGEFAPVLQIAALADPALEEALSTVPAGERALLPNGNEIAAIASFRGGEGELCREFEFDRAGEVTVVAVACHEGDGWNVRFAVVAAATSDTGYAPASPLEALDAYLNSTAAGPPLSPEEEAAALADEAQTDVQL